MTVDTTTEIDLVRLQREATERAAQMWDPQEAALIANGSRVVAKPATDEIDLVALQREATERAARNWDENEAPLLNDPVSSHSMVDAVCAALEATIDRGPNKTPFLGSAYLTEYTKSPHWRATRERALLRAGGYCARCRLKSNRLEVHHLTYRNLGQERESELIVLCHDCHATEHGREW